MQFQRKQYLGTGNSSTVTRTRTYISAFGAISEFCLRLIAPSIAIIVKWNKLPRVRKSMNFMFKFEIMYMWKYNVIENKTNTMVSLYVACTACIIGSKMLFVSRTVYSLCTKIGYLYKYVMYVTSFFNNIYVSWWKWTILEWKLHKFPKFSLCIGKKGANGEQFLCW